MRVVRRRRRLLSVTGASSFARRGSRRIRRASKVATSCVDTVPLDSVCVDTVSLDSVCVDTLCLDSVCSDNVSGDRASRVDASGVGRRR